MITREIFEALSDSGMVVHTQTIDQSIAMISIFKEVNPNNHAWDSGRFIRPKDCFRVCDDAQTLRHDDLIHYTSHGYKVVKFDELEAWYEEEFGICLETDGEIESLIGI